MPTPPSATQRIQALAWRAAGVADTARSVPEETAVAFSIESASYAVMMATPADLEDFAVGFCLTEGLIARAAEIEDIEVTATELGVVVNLRFGGPARDGFWQRRRRVAGPSGCGLCGIESLEQAMRRAPVVTSDLRVAPEAIAAALAALPRFQTLNRETRAVHAAAFWMPGAGIVAVREDVGRHNALDKLVGAMARASNSAADGVILLTSRVSVEMAQKAAVAGAGILVAVSAPTALALRTAEAAGITLIAVARDDGFEIFTHPERIMVERAQDVA